VDSFSSTVFTEIILENLLKWEPAYREIKVKGVIPKTSGKKKIPRKKFLKEQFELEIGEEDLKKIQTRCKKNPLSISVKFYLYYSEEQGRSKKDLDNLLKILLDVLSVNMVNGQDPVEGLGIVRDDSDVRQIKCEKYLVNSPEKEGIDLQISIGHN